MERMLIVEKRKSKRFPIHMKLDITSLFKQDNEIIEDINAPITIINISKTGIGFKSACKLPLNYYFNARIDLGDEENAFFVVIKIIRTQVVDESTYVYGCEFVGMPTVLDFIFDEFESRTKPR